MKKYIMGNFKMNFDNKEFEVYLEELKKVLTKTKNEVVIFPPFTLLSQATEALKNSSVLVGAQNVNENEKGAFTGEVSAKMLAEFSQYVLVGHSERRKYFFETNTQINQKIKSLLKYGIKPVLCIGETETERANGQAFDVLTKQLQEGLKGIYENEMDSIVIAYEPVWAIGTGKTAKESDVVEAVKHIRKVIKQNYSLTASEKLVVLYGGSIKGSNAKAYLSKADINGALIGGSSLNVEEFAHIAIEN